MKNAHDVSETQFVCIPIEPEIVRALQRFASVHQIYSCPHPTSEAELSRAAQNVLRLALANPQGISQSITSLMNYIRAEGLESDPAAQNNIVLQRIAATAPLAKGRKARA